MNVNKSPGKSETIAHRVLQECPVDLSCVTGKIVQSPQLPGNIEVIVQLLHNISTELTTEVDEPKMKVSGHGHPLCDGGIWVTWDALGAPWVQGPCLSLSIFSV